MTSFDRRSRLENDVNVAQRSSHNAWMGYGEDKNLQELFIQTAELLKIDKGFMSRGSGGFEDNLQVLRYDKNEHYDAHRDYWDPRQFPQKARWTSRNGFWQNRFGTVLWYLQPPDPGHGTNTSVGAGGETWFPRARGGPPPEGEWEACDERGIKVPPTEPVLFYSLQADGELDEYSWHCGCRVKDTATQPKFAANTWIWNTPSDGILAQWRRGERMVEGNLKSVAKEL